MIRCKRHFAQWPVRRGLTLVEVLASLAILGLLIGSVLVARARHVHQWALSQQKARAVAAADLLLAAWWSNPASLPSEGSGGLPGMPQALWNTRTIPDETLADLASVRVRFEVHSTLRAERDEPLVRVDLILPEPRKNTPDPKPEADEPQS